MNRNDIAQHYSPKLENLLLILTALQDGSSENHISHEDMEWVADYLNITKATVYGVVKYYSLFSTTPRGEHVLRICCSPVCHMMDSEIITKKLQSLLKVEQGRKSADGLFSFEKVECLGQCDKAPAMMINKKVYGHVTPLKLKTILANLEEKS